MDETRSVPEGSRLPLPGIIFMLSFMWLGLLGVTLWVWNGARIPAPLPVPSSAATATATATMGTSASTSGPLGLVWSKNTFNHFLFRVAATAAAVGVALLFLLLLGWGVHGRFQGRDE